MPSEGPWARRRTAPLREASASDGGLFPPHEPAGRLRVPPSGVACEPEERVLSLLKQGGLLFFFSF